VNVLLLDCETTGLSHQDNELIQIGLRLIDFKPSAGAFADLDSYVGCQEPVDEIPERITRINGFTKASLKGKKLDADKIKAILKKADKIVAHNATFDYYFIKKVFNEVEKIDWHCSMRGIPWRSRGHASMSLQSLLDDHSIINEKAHDAMADINAMLALLMQPSPLKSYKNHLSHLLKSPPITFSNERRKEQTTKRRSMEIIIDAELDDDGSVIASVEHDGDRHEKKVRLSQLATKPKSTPTPSPITKTPYQGKIFSKAACGFLPLFSSPRF
jgi:DNA polymerase-3 subunit epsilon